MKEKLFGTDGVRGIPGRYPMTQDMVKEMAFIAVRLLLKQGRHTENGSGPQVLMARDTRASGPALCRALVSGFSSAGCRTLDLGVAPTPAVAYLTPRLHALCGVVVSASHNPAEFNGIKFFTGDGFKMEEAVEEKIERALGGRIPAPKTLRPIDSSASVARYVEFLRSTFPATLDLSGLKLVVDCGHGAAYRIAPALFASLGAKVTAMNCAPNGKNINARCGALHTEGMRKEVLARRADCGVSLDGDADRAIFSDEKGRLVDGDAVLCLSALRLKAQGLLRDGKVVLTTMSNFGMIRFLETHGISVISVPVGDRNVTQAIEEGGLSLGGENSGHIIFRSFAATGDGMLTALQTLAALRESGKPLSRQSALYRATPQILKNIAVSKKVPLDGLPHLQKSIKGFEKRLDSEGRVFVRYSGTEPLLRIMVEGPRGSEVRRMAQDLADVYLKETKQ